jgi:hypothetical protein
MLELLCTGAKLGLNRQLRGISGPRRDEVTGGRRKQHNEKLHNVYDVVSIVFGTDAAIFTAVVVARCSSR